MKETLRPAMGWLHTWCGLIIGWLLCAIFMTGTLSVFREPITRWMAAVPPLAGGAQPVAPGVLADRAVAYLQQHATGARFWRVELPQREDEALRLFWRGRDSQQQQRAMHPVSGEILPSPWGRETQGGRHFMSFHYSLQGGLTGFWVVGVVSMAMLVALVSGVIVHKRIFSDFFTFRPNKGQRSWLDAHNASGVLTLPFLFMITLTGLWIFYTSYLPLPLRVAYGGDVQAYERLEHDLSGAAEPPRRKASGVSVPLPQMAPLLARAEVLLGGAVRTIVIERPGDSSMAVRLIGREPDGALSRSIRNQAGMLLLDGVSGEVLQSRKPDPVAQSAGLATHSVVEHLHFARFGGWSMRWLYFISGLAGTMLMATGCILYLVKRRQKSGMEFGAATARVYRCFEVLNIAAISGTALACAGYFYSNRLLPADVAQRGGWEIRCFFYVWLASLAHAALRPRVQAWREQLFAAALLCLALPLLNFATTGLYLGPYIATADWQSAGVELTAIGLGILLALAGFRTRGRQ